MDPASAGTRTETDTFGPIQVSAERLWGAQTQRSLEHFRISGERVPLAAVHALALVKKVVALVHVELGVLDAGKGGAIAAAADEVLGGRWDGEFPLVVWQTGSGTQTNMNVNEVLANRANEILGGELGSKSPVHPNDHVNLSQSSNDVFPTAMSVASVVAIEDRLLPSLGALAAAIEDKARSWDRIVKIGRTHLMDATPLVLGQEVGGWAAQLRHCIRHVETVLPTFASWRSAALRSARV